MWQPPFTTHILKKLGIILFVTYRLAAIVIWKCIVQGILNSAFTSDRGYILCSATTFQINIYLCDCLSMSRFKVPSERNLQYHGQPPNASATIIVAIDTSIQNKLTLIRSETYHS